MKDNHTLPTDEGLQGNEKMETAIAALQQEATEEEVKGSESVMSTFLQTVYKFIFRHDAMVYCSFHSDGLQPPVLSPPPTWLLRHAPSQARLSSQRR